MNLLSRRTSFQGVLRKPLAEFIWKGTLWCQLELDQDELDEKNLEVSELKVAHTNLNEWFF